MRTLTIFSILTLVLNSAIANAGQWICENGLDGKAIILSKIAGDERAVFGNSAEVAMVQDSGFPYIKYPLSQQAAKSDELARATIAEGTLGAILFRLLPGEVGPMKYRSTMRLVNFPIPQDLDGYCQYTP